MYDIPALKREVPKIALYMSWIFVPAFFTGPVRRQVPLLATTNYSLMIQAFMFVASAVVILSPRRLLGIYVALRVLTSTHCKDGGQQNE